MLDYLPIIEAEKIAGRKLDRRSKYFLWDVFRDGRPVLCKTEKFLSSCSGCHETDGYGTTYCGGYDKKRGMEVGSGCRECGYTGVRWNSFPSPINTVDSHLDT